MIRKISILMRSLFVVGLCFIVSSCSKKQEKREFVRAVKVAQVQSSAEIKKDFSGMKNFQMKKYVFVQYTVVLELSQNQTCYWLLHQAQSSLDSMYVQSQARS